MFSWNNLQEHTLETTGEKLTMIGSSVAGKATSFYIKNRNILLDCGLPSNYKPKIITITHMHYDHVCSIVRYFLAMDQDNTYRPVIICPNKSVNLLIQYIESAFMLTKNNNNNSRKILPDYTIVGSNICSNSNIIIDITNHSNNIISNGSNLHTNKLEPMEIVDKIDIDIIDKMKTPYEIEPIRCNHGGQPTHGYGFIELRLKLKDEYLIKDSSNNKYSCKLSREELIKLKKENKINTLKTIIKVPLFAYICDTDHKVFTRTGKYEGYKLDKYNVIIIECTFFKEQDLKKAKKDKHMHWINLRKYILDHPNKYFKLIHLSEKYTSVDIEDFQNIINKDNLNNRVTIIT